MQRKLRVRRIIIQFLFGSLCSFGMPLIVVFLVTPIIGLILTSLEKIAGAKFIYLINSELLLAILFALFVPIGSVVDVILGDKLIIKADRLFNTFQIISGYALGVIGFFFFLWGIPYILELFWPGVDVDFIGALFAIFSCPGSVLFVMIGYHAGKSGATNRTLHY